jgi:hypothetical protein
MNKKSTQHLNSFFTSPLRESPLPASESCKQRGISVGDVPKWPWRDSVKHIVATKKMDEY